MALAQKGIFFLFDLGYFKVNALASLATAGAYFCCRLNHQTNIYETVAGCVEPVSLEAYLLTVRPTACSSKKRSLSARQPVSPRVSLPSRMPEAVVNARRRMAHKNAKKKGYTPSQSPSPLMAWNLFITNVPSTIWTTATVPKMYPMRWQIELIFKSWKSYLPLAALTTTKETLFMLSVWTMLRILLIMRCVRRRATLWLQYQRELVS